MLIKNKLFLILLSLIIIQLSCSGGKSLVDNSLLEESKFVSLDKAVFIFDNHQQRDLAGREPIRGKISSTLALLDIDEARILSVNFSNDNMERIHQAKEEDSTSLCGYWQEILSAFLNIDFSKWEEIVQANTKKPFHSVVDNRVLTVKDGYISGKVAVAKGKNYIYLALMKNGQVLYIGDCYYWYEGYDYNWEGKKEYKDGWGYHGSEETPVFYLSYANNALTAFIGSADYYLSYYCGVNVPPYVNLSSPANDSTVAASSLFLSWWGWDNNSEDVLYYTLYLDTVNPPVNMVVQDYTGTTYDVSGLVTVGQIYYWRVKASDGQYETWSPIWLFTVNSN